MLDKLADIPTALRELIRHVCVRGCQMTIVYDEDDDCGYDTAQALEMLPGFNLDTLTVVGTGAWSHRLEAFYNIDSLIRLSDGWKELHYLADSPEPLAFKVDDYNVGPGLVRTDFCPRPQPADWQDILEQRDGQASHPSVAVYQGAAAATPDAAMPALHPCIHNVFARAQITDHLQKVFTRDARFFARLEDAAPITREALFKYMLLVVRRGVGVDYAEKEGSPYLRFGDIRKDSRGRTWKEIHPPPSTTTTSS